MIEHWYRTVPQPDTNGPLGTRPLQQVLMGAYFLPGLIGLSLVATYPYLLAREHTWAPVKFARADLMETMSTQPFRI